MTIRDGSKEPLEVEAVVAPVRAMLGRRIGPEERLVVIRTLGPGAKTTYAMSNAEAKVPLSKLVCVRSQRPRIERVLREGKGEVGLARLRGAQLGGLASPYHAEPPGVVVPGSGAAADGGEKPRP